MLKFTYATPEETGISQNWILNFANRLEYNELPLHSFILMKDDKIVAESYTAPYDANTNHRMFSITKSFVSIAIGLLESEGKLNLDDKLMDYFPEFKGDYENSKYQNNMTIREMLKMSSCFSFTTYKGRTNENWTSTFFTTNPTHVSGTTFSYDTSSTHTLCSLVEKLSGMEMLEYLRVKFLNDVGFSKSAYVMKVGENESYGGSGLMCTPMDLLRFFYVITHNGNIDGKQYLPSDYIKQATSRQIDTFGKMATFEEMQGYGYQFWMTSHGGYACYGMGGQYAMFFPEKNVTLITTADTQGRNAGTQLIYDSFYQEIYDKIGAMDIDNDHIFCRLNPSYICSDASKEKDYSKSLAARKLPIMAGDNTSSIIENIKDVRYVMDANSAGFKWISISFDKYEGTFDYETSKGVFSLPFGIGYNQIVTLNPYNSKSAVSGAFRDNNTFLIRLQVIDEHLGNAYIQLSFKDDDVTLMMRKFEEDIMGEFNGLFSGHRA